MNTPILLGILLIIILVGVFIGIQMSIRPKELTPEQLEVQLAINAKRQAEEEAENAIRREQARQENLQREKEAMERVKKLNEEAVRKAAEINAANAAALEESRAVQAARKEEEAKRVAGLVEKAESEGRASVLAYNAKLEQERAAAEAKRLAEEAVSAAAEAERLRQEEQNKLLLQSTPIDYIRLGRARKGPIDVAEIQVYNLSNELIPIIEAYYISLPENYKKTHSYESINAIDGKIDTFARLDGNIEVQLTPTRISNISKIVITPKPGETLRGTYVSFHGTPEGKERRQELLNRINITEDKSSYTFRFSGSGTNTSWLSSRINLPQYLRYLQNKNYLL